MKTEPAYKGKLDLLVLDIDDTFIYHLTVAAANRIFLGLVYGLFGKRPKKDRIYTTKKSIVLILKAVILNFFRLKFDKIRAGNLAKLATTALLLHLLNMARGMNNRLFGIASSERMIRMWANAVVGLKIKTGEYLISKEAVENGIDRKVLGIYDSLRKSNPGMGAIAITQSFSTGHDPIKDILNLDMIESNRFKTDKQGIISGFELNVRNGRDKKRIAVNAIRNLKAKKVGLFIEDYDDIDLLELKGVRFVLYKKRLERFVRRKKGVTAIAFR